MTKPSSSKKHFIAFDFEFNHTNEPTLNVICVALYYSKDKKIRRYWLLDEKERKAFISFVTPKLNENHTFITHSAIAEGRAMLDLGFTLQDLLKTNWFDTLIEYKHQANSNHEIQYGKHLVKGVVKYLTPPKDKWERTEDDDLEIASNKITYSLSEAVFKYLGVRIDQKEKDEVRDLIISKPKTFTKTQKQRILDYCESDIKYLYNLAKAQMTQYKKLKKSGIKFKKTCKWSLSKQIYKRGEFAVRCAQMEKIGYPVDIPQMKNLTDSVGFIIREIQKDINKQFPSFKIFQFDRKNANLVFKQKETKDAIKKLYPHLIDKWMLTDTGELSLSLKAFEKHFSFKYDFPRGHLGAQIIRFLKTKQNFNGFLPNRDGKKKKNIWDSTGSDGRVRVYANPYGGQTSRSQYGSTEFMFLKSAWIRTLVKPIPGRVILDIDYGSEEYLIGAVLAQDKNMIDSYHSGDPYLSFAKLSGMVPQNATKKTHSKERGAAKSTTLGVGYGMGSYSLANKLTEDTGEKYSVEKAQDLIDKFFQTYSDFNHYKKEIMREYYIPNYWDFVLTKRKKLEGMTRPERNIKENTGWLQTPCGWVLFPHNDNQRSVTNFPLQSYGASIIRKAVEICQDKGLDVLFSLHDAAAVEVDLENYLEKADIFAESMFEAFVYYFPKRMKEDAKKIRLDIEAWGPGLPKTTLKQSKNGDCYVEGKKKLKTPKGRDIVCSDVYIDERGINELYKYKGYLEEGIVEL